MMPGMAPSAAATTYGPPRGHQPVRRVQHRRRHRDRRACTASDRAVEFPQVPQDDRQGPSPMSWDVPPRLRQTSPTHKTPEVRAWLRPPTPASTVHFTPPAGSSLGQPGSSAGSASWPARCFRRGVHKERPGPGKGRPRPGIENWNQDPKPFTWTKTAEEILNSLAKYMARNFRRRTLVVGIADDGGDEGRRGRCRRSSPLHLLAVAGLGVGARMVTRGPGCSVDAGDR